MIKDRIVQLIEHLGVSKEKFYTEIGMTSANFRGKNKETPINSNAIENIFSKIPGVNLEWLIAGKGEMFVKNKVINQKYDAENGIILTLIEKNEKLNQEVGELKNENKNLRARLDDVLVSKKTVDMAVDNQEII
jgi:hypothetical protein